MIKHPWWLPTTVPAAIAALSARAWAGGKPAEHVVVVADMRGLDALRAWWANLYNASPLWSSILTVLAIATLGLLLSRLADTLFNWLELKLRTKARERRLE